MEDTKIYQYLHGCPTFSRSWVISEEMPARFSQLIIDFHQIKEIDITFQATVGSSKQPPYQ